MAKDLDCNMPRSIAERLLNASAGVLSLDELAQRISVVRPDDPWSVRENGHPPIPYIAVYHRGRKTDAAPYMSHLGRRVDPARLPLERRV